MEKDKQNSLAKLKKTYKELNEKYDLPSFEKLNQDFNIEKISEIETEYLIREIRKFMADKFSNYLRFIEAILNPTNAPMFVFSFVKSINSEEKEKLKTIYQKLAKIEINLIEIDLEFSIEKEVEFIVESNKIWQEIKKDMLKVIRIVKQNWDKKAEVNGKSYFG